MKKECSENEVRNKAEAYCSSVERCVSEVEAKLEQWGADNGIKERVIEHLIKEKYIDQQRYCAAFVRDKYRFNQWGRMKIVQALRMKQLPSEDIEAGLEEIDEEEYSNVLKSLLAQKARGLKAGSDYERNSKLIRFAVSRGFAMDEVLRYIRQTDEFLD